MTTTIPASATLDLHLHTRASDGDWTPETLVARAAALGLRVMAVADHDAIDSVEAATALAAARGIVVLPAAEMTTRWDGRQWHLLVYNADLRASPFRALVDRQRQRHIERAEQAIAALRAAGYAVPSLSDVVGGRPPLPIYVMMALVRDGLAANILRANHFVRDQLGIPFYVDLPLEETVAAARASGGVTVLAHPGRADEYEPLDEARLHRLLAAAPVDGLEVDYPTHTPEQVAFYRDLAARYDLLCSSGSDSHGPNRPRDPVPYPAAAVAALLERCGLRLEAAEGR